jgi:hypothetical protein
LPRKKLKAKLALVAASKAVGLVLLESLALSRASLSILSFLLQTRHWIAACVLIVRSLLAQWLVTLRTLLHSSTL